MKRKVRPNVVSGGTAINLGNNLYYMRGKTHKQGGIDIGSNPKTGIEVENGEVVQASPTGLRVFSAQPILNGISPANALLMGGNPNNIFNAQEAWKQVNHYNDDGTKFKIGGKEKKSLKDRIRNKLIDVYYNTTFKPAIKKYGIDEVRLRLYDNIHPFGYENAQSRIDYAINKEPLSDIERKDYPYSEKDFYENKLRDDIWRTYLNVDKKYSHYGDGNGHKVIESKYKPTNSNENKKYYTITHDDYNGLYSGGMKGKLVSEVLFGNPINIYENPKSYQLSIGAIKHGENRLSNTLGRYFGTHTISRGMDPKKGDYVSFYDLWDIAPSEGKERTGRKDESRGIGSPIEFYDRLYLNDYFDVEPKIPKDSYYEGYLTPSFISEEKEYGGYTPSQEIIDYIKKTEGFRDKWYKDGNGIDTIGYGFTGSRIKKLYPNGITREQADKEFADSIVKRAAILQRDTPNWNKLSQKQRDALLSYHYNVGEGSYRNKHKKLQQALADSDWENVVLNMDAGYNDKKNPGLRTRRDYERELFRSGMVASLTGDEEKAFRDWYDRYARSQNLDPNPDAKEHYYDYRTYWKNRTEQQKNDEWKLGNHLPDTYKKPGHPTFSTESIYSTRKTPGGTWKKVGLGPVYDEQFVAPKNTRRLKKYNNVSFALGGDDLKQNGYIEPSVITVPLPKKFKGSQAAAKRYAEGYQFGKQIAKERDKTVPYILAAANAPMLIEGLAVAPLATIGSLAGGHIGGTIGNKVGGPLGGAIGGLIGGGLGAGAGIGIKAGIKPTIKYGNGVLDRTAEALIRLGDAAHTPNEVAAQFLNKNTLKYIFNPKAKNLAYKMPYKYSGQSTELTDAFPGDVVDQFLGKSPVPNATYDLSILSKGMRDYISKYYPNKKIPIRNLGEVSSERFSINIEPKIREQFKTGKATNVGGTGNINDLSGNGLLDAGGFNAVIKNAEPINNNGYTLANVKGTDIWKFNPKDYSNRYGFGATDLLKKLGLKFIDSRGTPIIHTFESQVPIYTGKINYKYGGIHIKPSKRGTFTAAAKRHHMGVQEFARTVLNNRARFSAAMVKKANFARNASKWHKKELGGDMTKQYYITKDNIYSLGGNVKPKAQLGTKYVVDKYGRIVPVNIPNTDINIANIGEINRLLDPVTVTDSAPKTPSITGRAEIIPQINQSILAPNSHVIQRRLPVSIQDIVNPITSPRDSALNKPDFNSTMLAAFPNPDFDATVGSIKEKSSTGVTPRNPYYSKLNIGLHKAGNYIKNNPDLLGLGINLTGNLAASLINRSAIKGMRYGDVPIPISAQKLPTEVNIEPQVSSIRENVAGQERLIADNTADSRVALARRQRVRNQGAQQYQTLYGNKLNTELQLLTADRLNRQGVDAQNVTQYNQWRRGLYDFENRRREMLAENAVAGINNAAEAIAGERGYLARREARRQNLLNMGLIAATSPNAQNVIGSKEFEEFLRKIGYDGNFSLLRKRING